MDTISALKILGQFWIHFVVGNKLSSHLHNVKLG